MSIVLLPVSFVAMTLTCPKCTISKSWVFVDITNIVKNKPSRVVEMSKSLALLLLLLESE